MPSLQISKRRVLRAFSNMQTAESQEPLLNKFYGNEWRELDSSNERLRLIASFDREIDLVELEQLCDAVGWCRRPQRRVRTA